MAAAPSPSVSPATTPNPAHEVLHGLWTGILSLAQSAPWLVALFALAIVLSVVRFIRDVVHSGPRDPARRFSRSDKALILSRAGGRCEHHALFFGRCRATANLEADHVHPHSKGGWTNVANGQALCRTHNRMKRASIPWDRQLRALERRRESYFPDGATRSVVRKPTRPTAGQSIASREATRPPGSRSAT